MFVVLQQPNGGGPSWKLGRRPIVIGRSEGCEIRLLDSALSRRHARLWFDGEKACLEDLGSRNATLVNGAPVKQATLEPGDVIGLGSTLLRVEAQGTLAMDAQSDQDGSTPITLSVGLTSYVQDAHVPKPEWATPRTVQELHALYHFGVALGAVECTEELANVLRQALREQFSPTAIWVAWQFTNTRKPVFQVDEGSGPDANPPNELMQKALESGDGIIKPGLHTQGRERYPQTLMAVPMVHGGEVLGGFVLCGRAPVRTYAEQDLNYALGMATLAAPHIRAIRHLEQLRRDNQALQDRAGTGPQLLGESPDIQDVREWLIRAAASDLPVLILGETGTGKEIAARMLHEASARRDGPYVVVNCAAIPDHLFESEFFGHEKGAFTGATKQRIGRFQEAHGGTLFLDEIGDLAPENQARILRAIENGGFHRVGGERLLSADVRIVAATNKTLTEPDFRADLLHRLNSVAIHMPPLRERKEDIPLLARHFLRLASGHGPVHVHNIKPETMKCLQDYEWPGNVRELKAQVDRAVLFARNAELSPYDFRPDSSHRVRNDAVVYGSHNPSVQSCDRRDTLGPPSLADIEREHILHMVQSCNGNISEAARMLQINRATLYRRLAEYGE